MDWAQRKYRLCADLTTEREFGKEEEDEDKANTINVGGAVENRCGSAFTTDYVNADWLLTPLARDTLHN